MSSNPPDDFEYQLADEDTRRCPHCGAQMTPTGCPACTQKIAEFEELTEEDEIDEYGMPIGAPPPPEERRSSGWGELLEMDEQDDGDLPASFYAIALAVIVVIGLASVVSESPAAASWWVGLMMTVGGSLTLGLAYYWLSKELEDSLATRLAVPFRAIVEMVKPSESPLPRLPSIDVAKWALVALVLGLLAMGLGGVMALIANNL